MATPYSTGAELGPAYAGRSVGYRLDTLAGAAVARFTPANVVPTTIPGDYTVTGGLPVPAGFAPGRVVWGLPGLDLAEELFDGVAYAPASYPTLVSLGPLYANQAVGYRLVDASGVVAAFTTAGVTAAATPGDYAALVPLPAGFLGRVVYGTAGADLAEEWVQTAPAAAPFTPDPDFLEGCIHAVSVAVNANAGGDTRSPRGGVKDDWQPVPGKGAVRCRVVPDRDAERDEDNKQGAGVNYKILLPTPEFWTQDYQVTWVDPDGLSHTLRIQGQPRNAHGMSVFWVAKAQEIVH